MCLLINNQVLENTIFFFVWQNNCKGLIIVDLIEISTLSGKHSGNIQLINNSDKGSGNTLQSSSQATE